MHTKHKKLFEKILKKYLKVIIVLLNIMDKVNYKWDIQNNYIFGYDLNINSTANSNIKFVYLFDLDYTLIKTKSGNKFPKNKSDWEILYPNIPDKLSKLNKTESLIGIITNQKGLLNNEKINDWIDKIKCILDVIRIDFIFASIIDDRYRKPMCGSFEYLKKFYININWDKILKSNKIYYIGDACGRKTDFSDTDIKYAINCKFKFKTPETFFSITNSNSVDKKGSITYPELNYYTKKEQNLLFEQLYSIINLHTKILIITIGLPGSGKSFLRNEIIKKFPQFYYSNNDDIKNNKSQSKMLIKKISPEYEFIIDDNTNMNKLNREEKLNNFKSYYKIGIYFDYDLDTCYHLNLLRMYWFNCKLISKITYYTLIKYFDKNNLDNKFDKFIKINKIFNEFNFDDKIKYYF